MELHQPEDTIEGAPPALLVSGLTLAESVQVWSRPGPGAALVLFQSSEDGAPAFRGGAGPGLSLWGGQDEGVRRSRNLGGWARTLRC